MQIAIVSDTHTNHRDAIVPDADMVLFCGDFDGGFSDATDFLEWFSELPHEHKVMIAGNHDRIADKDSSLFREMIPEGVHYLENSGVTLGGLNIWGSPYVPTFGRWYFMKPDGVLATYWDAIPDDTDVLLTHGPAMGILDKNLHGENCGSRTLRHRIDRLDSLSLHCFGHIHEAWGVQRASGRLCVNAALDPIRVTLPIGEAT